MKKWLNANLALVTGLTMGISAALAQAFLYVSPPVAYGVCLLGHPKDMADWIVNKLFGTNWPIHEAFPVFTSLLVVGVFIGSFLAANRNAELKLRPGPVRNKYMAILFGFLAVNLGLLWGACPIRTGLLAAYGNTTAIIVLVSIAVGVLIACRFVRWQAKRGI